MNPSPCNGMFYSREDYTKLTPGNQVFLKNFRDKKNRVEDLKDLQESKNLIRSGEEPTYPMCKWLLISPTIVPRR